METRYQLQYQKLISYLGAVGISKTEGIAELKKLDRNDLESALKNIDMVPDWYQKKEREMLKWVKESYGNQTLISLVVISKPEQIAEIRIWDAYCYANREKIRLANEMGKVPFNSRLILE